MYIAPNPRLNASLADGQRLLGQIAVAGGISANPRLYANDSGAQSLHPATDAQDNSDLPAWVVLGNSVESDGTDPNLPIYLQVYTAESGNFHDVADVLRFTGDGRMTLAQALS